MSDDKVHVLMIFGAMLALIILFVLRSLD